MFSMSYTLPVCTSVRSGSEIKRLQCCIYKINNYKVNTWKNIYTLHLNFSRGDAARRGDQGKAAGTVYPRSAEEGEADRAREGRAGG